MTDDEVCKRCNLPEMAVLLKSRRLKWTGHVIRMDECRLPKCLLHGQLASLLENAMLDAQDSASRIPSRPLQRNVKSTMSKQLRLIALNGVRGLGEAPNSCRSMGLKQGDRSACAKTIRTTGYACTGLAKGRAGLMAHVRLKNHAAALQN